jgi:heme A synthase
MQGNGTITILIVGALILFALFRRAKGLITRQKIRPNTMAVRLGIFAVLGAAILLLTLNNAPILLGDVIGLALGAGLAWVGLRLTTFDRQPDGLYYTPNKYIGIGVFALFAIRLVYKLVVGLSAVDSLAGTTARGAGLNALSQFSSDPLTTAVYFLLIGYYAFYYTMLILRYRQTAATG